MEELITLHHGNFAILGRWVKEFDQRTGCSNWVADLVLQSQLFLDEMKKEHPGWNTVFRQERSLFPLEQMFHNAATMWCKEHQRCSKRLPLKPTETAPEHPSVWNIIGSWIFNLLWVMEQIYKGKYMVAPSMFTHVQQENFMKWLWWEISRCMFRADLWSERGPAELPSRTWRCSWGLVEEEQVLEEEEQWTGLAFRPCPLLSWGHSPWLK